LVGQPEGNPELRNTGLNPVHSVLGFCLDTQINSKYHETLGPKNTLGIEYNQGSKVGSWLTFVAFSTGQVKSSRGDHLVAFTHYSMVPPAASLPKQYFRDRIADLLFPCV